MPLRGSKGLRSPPIEPAEDPAARCDGRWSESTAAHHASGLRRWGFLCSNCRVLQCDDLPASLHSFNHRGDDPEAGSQLVTLPVHGATQFDNCVDDRQLELVEPNRNSFLSELAVREDSGMPLSW